MMRRRWFLLSIAVAGSILACSLPIGGNPAVAPATGTVPSASSGGEKPNIIFVLTDDLDAASMAYMPELKALIADQGVTFENYFVPESLCCPSRASTLRGQYPHNTQILTNSPPLGGFQRFVSLGEDKSTAAVWLQNAGYRTMLAGKYLNGYPDKQDLLYIPPGWNEWFVSVKGNAYAEYNYTLNENGNQVAYGKSAEDYGTDVYVGKAVDFIRRNADEGKPFFVYLAPYAPHSPYTPAPRHADLFPDAAAPRTPNFNEGDVSDKPAYIRDRAALTDAETKEIDKAYRIRLQALQAVDEGIASMVEALREKGQLDNTYIFFASDNGYHMGNHRQVLGKISPYEEELHLRLFVRGPGVPAGKILEHLVGNIDLAPTFADIGGAAAGDFCDGRSLLPLLKEAPLPLESWRQIISLEWGKDTPAPVGASTQTSELDAGLLEPLDYDEQNPATTAPGKKKPEQVPDFRGVRLLHWSYVEYSTGEKELYDLRTDPYQLHNLVLGADPSILKKLSDLVAQLSACKADGCRAIEDAIIDWLE